MNSTASSPRGRCRSAVLLACLLPLFASLPGCGERPSSRAAAPARPSAAAIGAGQRVGAGDLQVSNAWARATVGGAPVAAVYFTVANHGAQADTLLGATSPLAASAMFHDTSYDQGVARMHPAGELALAPGQVLQIVPAGLHLMLDGLKQPLVAGMRIPVVLRFQRAGAVELRVEVIPLTAGRTS